VVAALDALRQLHLLHRGEQRHPADVLEEQLQRVGGDLGLGLPLAVGLVRRILLLDDLDLCLVEGRVELVERARVEVELVQRERQLLGVEAARGAAGLE
jgi:hypothetical protein